MIASKWKELSEDDRKKMARQARQKQLEKLTQRQCQVMKE